MLRPPKTHSWQDPKLADFRSFVFLLWKHLNLPDPTPIQYDMADVLQQTILGNGPDRLLVEGFRGVAKSWLTSALSLWELYWWPDHNLLVTSASKSRSDEFSTFVMRLIEEVPCLAPLRAGDDRRKSITSFDVGPAPASHAPSVRSVGITGQLTGSRANTIIADDVEAENNSATDMQREKLLATIRELDAIVKPNGKIIYLGTPHTEQSVYGQLEARGYTAYFWPARYPDERLARVYGPRLAPFIRERLAQDPALVGRPTDPERFGEADLQQREAAWGRSGFALQYMLDTSLADAERYPLKLADLIVDDLDARMGPAALLWSGAAEFELRNVPSPGFMGDRFHGPWQRQGAAAPYQGVIVAVDPAGAGADELGLAVVGGLNGNVFVFECEGLKGGYVTANLERIAYLAQMYGANRILIEENFGMGMFAELLKPILQRIYPCTVELVRHSKQKELRIIDTLEPVMNQHRLVIASKVVHRDSIFRPEDGERARDYSLFHQMTRVTKERGSLRHDDRLDALAIAVTFWTLAMGIDRHSALKQQEHALWLSELEELERAIGPGVFRDTSQDKPSGFLARNMAPRKMKDDFRDHDRDRRFGRVAPFRNRIHSTGINF